MIPKVHGTSNKPMQTNLCWGWDPKLANRICNYNRHHAEYSGYFEDTLFFEEERKSASEQNPVNFHDSNTGKQLFVAPIGRTFRQFEKESKSHGWPIFRDVEVDWTHVRVLPNGEVVSLNGKHLVHNIPDKKGNRYCINLVSIAGQPVYDHE